MHLLSIFYTFGAIDNDDESLVTEIQEFSWYKSNRLIKQYV